MNGLQECLITVLIILIYILFQQKLITPILSVYGAILKKKKFLEYINVEQKIFDEKENNHINIVELCKKDTVFSLVLEDLFQFHFNYKSEDMLLFYLKDTNLALLKLKSYHPYYVLEEEKYITENEELSKKGIVLQKELEDNTSPYWSILIENKEIINSLNSICEEYPSNTLCILAY